MKKSIFLIMGMMLLGFQLNGMKFSEMPFEMISVTPENLWALGKFQSEGIKFGTLTGTIQQGSSPAVTMYMITSKAMQGLPLASILTSSVEEIKKVYKKLALQYHPDKAAANKLPPEAATTYFQGLSNAYNALLKEASKIAPAKKATSDPSPVAPAPVSPAPKKEAKPTSKEPVPTSKQKYDLSVTSDTPAPELIDRLNTLVKILNNHTEKMAEEYASGKFGQQKAEAFVYSTIRTIAGLKSKFPDGFSETSEEGQASQAAFEALQKLTRKMLGPDGMAFIKMFVDFMARGGKFDETESEETLNKAIDYVQRLKNKKLFAHTQHVDNLMQFIKKGNLDQFIDERFLIKAVYDGTKHALKIFIDAYKKLLALEMKKAKPTEFENFLKVITKAYHAFSSLDAVKERDIVIKDALKKFVAKLKGKTPEDSDVVSETEKIFEKIKSKIISPDAVLSEKLGILRERLDALRQELVAVGA